jgi:hypothetical protein
MKMTFKIILIITIIFFSNESLDGVCSKDSDCFDFDKEDKCEDIAEEWDFVHVWKDMKEIILLKNV